MAARRTLALDYLYQVRATLDALLGRLERELAKEAKEVAKGAALTRT